MADIVELLQLHHQMVDAGDAGPHQRQRVMARIDVEEIGRKRTEAVVRDAEAEHLGIEAQLRWEIDAGQDGMAETERAGSEPRDVAAWRERRGGDLRPMKQFDPIAVGIEEPDHLADASPRGETGFGAVDGDTLRLQSCRHGVERRGVGDLPTEVRRGVAGGDVQPGPSIVHTEGEGLGRCIRQLEAEQIAAEVGPFREVGRGQAHISEREKGHRGTPYGEFRRDAAIRGRPCGPRRCRRRGEPSTRAVRRRSGSVASARPRPSSETRRFPPRGRRCRPRPDRDRNRTGRSHRPEPSPRSKRPIGRRW